MANLRERQAALAAAVRGLFQALDRWSSTREEVVTAGFEQAVERFLALVGESSGAGGCEAIVDVGQRLAEPWRAWKDFSERTQLRFNFPDGTFWATLTEVPPLLAGLLYPPPMPLEPLGSLVKHMTTPAPSPGWQNQVCRMYGFMIDGQPQHHWIDEELAQPGKHTGPGTGWEHPIAKRRKTQAAEEIQAALAVLGRCEQKMVKLDRPCPESLETLIGLDVALPQICRMMKKSEAQVLEACHEKGLKEPRRGLSIDSVKRGSDTRSQAEIDYIGRTQAIGKRPDSQEAPADPVQPASTESLDQRIITMHTSGYRNAAIVKELKAAGEEIDKGRVEAVVSRYEEHPELFVQT